MAPTIYLNFEIRNTELKLLLFCQQLFAKAWGALLEHIVRLENACVQLTALVQLVSPSVEAQCKRIPTNASYKRRRADYPHQQRFMSSSTETARIGWPWFHQLLWVRFSHLITSLSFITNTCTNINLIINN